MVIPDGVKIIGDYTFLNCNAVSIIIPNSVTTIGYYAFENCKSLQSINIPNSVTTIDDYAFEDCNFTSITIPSSVQELYYSAFSHCDNLQKVYIENLEEDFTWEGDEEDLPISTDAIVYLEESLPDDVLTVMLPDGITATDDGITTFGNRVYVTSGATLTLSHPKDGYSFVVPEGCSFDETDLILSNITADINIALNVPDITYVLNVLDGNDVEVKVLNKGITGDIVIPEQVTINGSKYSVTDIPSECFENCTNIKSITIPNSVYFIGENAFDGCTNLKTITIDNYEGGITDLYCEFPDNVEVKYLRKPEFFKFTQIGNTNTVMVEFGGKQLIGAIEIPATTTIDGEKYQVVAIAEMGFQQQRGITSVTIPEGVTYIGKWAFASCTKLTSVNIPSTVTDIDAPFVGCSSLKNVNIAEGSPLTFNNGFLINNIKDENGTFTEKVLVGYYGNDVNVAVPDGVTTIAEDAFVYNYAMESLFIPSSVKSLAFGFIFMDDSNIKSIYVDNSEQDLDEETAELLEYYKHQSIDVYYLKDIEGIEKACYVSIPSGFTAQGEGIKTVGNRVYLNENITSFKLAYTSSEPLPDGSKLIADDKNITIAEKEDYYLVSNIKGNAEIILELPLFRFKLNEDDLAEVYPYNPQKISGAIEIPSTYTIDGEEYNVVAIGEEAFEGCENITSVTIPEGVTTIGAYAFYGCYSLQSINIPKSLEEIQDGAFSCCTALTNVVIDKGNKNFTLSNNLLFTDGGKTVVSCIGNPTEVVIPDDVTLIMPDAFYGYINISDVYFEADPGNVNWNEYYCDDFMGGENEYITKLHVLPQYLDAWNGNFGSRVNVTFVTLYIYSEVDQSLYLDGKYAGAGSFSIDEDRPINTVKLDRTFTPGVYSTVILPFKVANPNEIGTFYTFNDVTYENGEWVADVTKTDVVNANTPYLLKTKTANPDFGAGVEKLEATPDKLTTENNKWAFTGTYEYKQWENGDTKVYGFAGEEVSSEDGDITIGEFVQAGAGASINPFRCYLTFKGDKLGKRTPVMPQSIKVRVVDPKEEPSAEIVEPESELVITPVTEISEQISAKAWSFNGTIYIESQPGTDYQIIDLFGRVIKIGVTHSTREEITLNRNAGIVIVNINGKSFKVNL